jgi:predicted permease
VSTRRPLRWLHLLGLSKPSPDESASLEIDHHLAEHVDRLVAEGWNPDDAQHEAERQLGDRRRYLQHMRRLERAQRSSELLVSWVEVARQSLRSVARTARREPGFTAAVVLTLGLGIGANATMYGIIDRLMLKGPEHVVDPDDVVRVLVERQRLRTDVDLTLTPFVAYPDYLDLLAHPGLAGSAAFVTYGPPGLAVGNGESTTPATVESATAGYFPLLGVQPHLGRLYTAEEGAPGSHPTAIIGYDYWRTTYGADPRVLGRDIEVEGFAYTIVGVAPRHFTGVGLARVDVWLPLEVMHALHSNDPSSLLERSFYSVNAVARLNGLQALRVAEAEATRLHLNARSGMIAEGRYSDRSRIVLGPLIEARGTSATNDTRVARWLTGVALIVLLIACANVANLLLARATKLRREVGVRLALGAGRRRVVLLGVFESLILGLVGGAVALFIARWGGELVRSTLLPDVYFPDSALTARTQWFVLATAILAGVVPGAVAALQSARGVAASEVQREGLGSSPRRSRARGALTVAQASLTTALLVGAALFVRSLSELRSIDLGLDVDRLVLVFPEPRDPAIDGVHRAELAQEAADRTRSVPGVVSAALSHVSLGSYTTLRVQPRDGDSIPFGEGRGPFINAVSPEYFETMGLTVVRGRGLLPSDGPDDERIAVVSETMASAFWPDSDPVGQYLARPGDDDTAFLVVGVVEDAARTGFFDPPTMAYYVPAAQSPQWIPGVVHVRVEGSTRRAADRIAAELRSYSPDVRWVRVRPVNDVLDTQARSWTLGATMFTIFGLLALVVAAVGLYSVLAFDVAQRTREIGIRTALGARKGRLLRSVVTQGARLGAVGVALGLAAAYVAAPYVQDLLFETSPRDPTIFATVALVLLVVSVVASLAPALRATRVDPVKAMRAE